MSVLATLRHVRSMRFNGLSRRCLQLQIKEKCRPVRFVSSEVGNQEIGIIGIPFSKGQPKSGSQQAPARLRDAGLVQRLELMGYNVSDYGDLQFEQISNDPPSYNIKWPRSIGGAARKMSEKVADVVGSGRICLTLGGDHSMSIGTVAGHASVMQDISLVWVDAHTDINPPLSSMSGNIHGMVLSFLCHELQEFIPQVDGFDWLKPCIRVKDIAFIGVRDIDPAERFIIEKYGITCYTMHDIDRHGIDYVLEHAIDAVNPGLKKPMHVSIDIDSLDPVVSPSTGTPVPGGLTIREGMFVAEELALTGKLSAIDLVEVNPELGSELEQELTLNSAVEVLSACFGKRRKGNVQPDYQLPKP